MASKEETKMQTAGGEITPHDHIPDKKNQVSGDKIRETAAEQAWGELKPNAKGVKTCPWCGFESIYGGDADKEPLKAHFISEHQAALTLYFANPDLGFNAHGILVRQMQAEEDDGWEPFEKGVEAGWESYDGLYVPEVYKDKYLKNGGKFRVCREDKIQYYKDRGAELVARDDGSEEGPTQNDHTDTRVRMNECTLMYFPEAVCKQFAAVKKMKIDQQGDLKGSQEAIDASRTTDFGEKAYNYYRKRDMSHENAMRQAKRAEAAHYAGTDGPDRRERNENRYIHTR